MVFRPQKLAPSLRYEDRLQAIWSISAFSIGIFFRDGGTNFTSPQRSIVLLASILTIMAADALFYGIETKDKCQEIMMSL